jgi:hypothetical protein
MTRTSVARTTRSAPTFWISPVSRYRNSSPLHPQRHLPDFVQENGAVVGHLELTGFVAVGAREAALDVAEQLGFQERLGNSGAIDRDEDLGAGTGVIDGASHHFLAGAALAGDEHLGVGARHPINFRLQF